MAIHRRGWSSNQIVWMLGLVIVAVTLVGLGYLAWRRWHDQITVSLLQGLMAPTTAGITVYIAWQQWRTNKRKLDLDLYDRRLRVYQQVVIFLSTVNETEIVPPNVMMDFERNTAEADFLFGSEIRAYLHFLLVTTLERNITHQRYRDSPPLDDHDQKIVDDHLEKLRLQFLDQHDVAKQKFMRYLKISKR